MDHIFPFDCPAPTLLYLTLYIVTLALHVVVMNYVFAGTAYLAIASLVRPSSALDQPHSSITSILRDWLPFAFGATITAGVAPLLFVQVLYKQYFYTSNLLLFHRWMAILPALIAAFYLLYLLKSKMIGHWPAVLRIAVALGAFVAICFVGYSWTENHLLSLDRPAWVSFYEEQRSRYQHPALLPRLAMWLAGSVPTMMTLVCWQLLIAQRRGMAIPEVDIRRAARWACLGLLASVTFGVVLYWITDSFVRSRFAEQAGGLYLAIASSGIILQAIAWRGQWRSGQLSGRRLITASLGLLLTILGMCVAREAMRFANIDVPALYEQHAQAAESAGLLVFAIFFLINTALIAGCVLAVRRDLRLDRVSSAPTK